MKRLLPEALRASRRIECVSPALAALVCLALSLSPLASARAETVAIVHAKAWTLTDDAALGDATIVITNGKIASVTAGAAAPEGARVIDARGKVVTPGLMHPATQLGLIEVSSAAETKDGGVSAGPLGAAFDVQYAINPNSSLIPLARSDGLTRAISYPTSTGVAPFAGKGVSLRLVESGDWLDRAGIGVFAVIGDRSSGSAGGSRAAQWQLLRIALDNAKAALAKPPDPATRTPEFVALEPVLAGKVPLALSTNRKSDLLQAIRLGKDYSVRIVVIGGAEAWMVAKELAAVRIPVILDPQANLPASFDLLGSRLDNAALLRKAGVDIAFYVVGNGIHQSYNAGLSIREGAGLAVANGLPYIEGLRAITTAPASIWGVAEHYGTLTAGKDGDVVIWDGDPLEPSALALHVFVQGKEVSLSTHQTGLRDRYMPKAGLAPAPRSR